MKPHKHAELIKAWADGAIIEGISPSRGIDWWMVEENPDWANTEVEYRIKPEPKPDVVADVYLQYNLDSGVEMYKSQTIKNIRLKFNYYTGGLQSAEVLK